MAQFSCQRGNALFIILIAVALLAALSFAVTYSSQTGGDNVVTKEKARLIASEILEYSKTVTNAVAQLRLRGCQDSELSFANVTVNSYTNNNAPTDDTCHVFHPAGGGVSWSVPQAGVTMTSPSPNNSWAIYGNNEVKDVGLSGGAEYSELLLVLNDLNPAICKEINGLLKITTNVDEPPEDSAINTGLFTGGFSFQETLGDEDARLGGQKAGCFKDDGQSKYIYYKVLVAR